MEKTYAELVKENERLKDEIKGQWAEAHPLRMYFDDVLEHPEVMSNKEVAEEYGLCPRDFYEILKEESIVRNEMIVPELRRFSFYNSGWTQSGRLFLYGILGERGVSPLVESWMGNDEEELDEYEDEDEE